MLMGHRSNEQERRNRCPRQSLISDCNKSIAAVITAADKELICHFCLQTNNAMNNESMSVRTLAGKCERSTKLLKVQMITATSN